MKSCHNLLLASDSRDVTILMLLDITAAFNTVDHRVLIAHLDHCVGIKEWFNLSCMTEVFFFFMSDLMSMCHSQCHNLPFSGQSYFSSTCSL